MTLKRDAIRAALRTFAQAWIPLLVLSLTGWLQDMEAWVGDPSHPFPAIPPLVKVAASALVAALAGLISLVHNLVPVGKQAVYIDTTAVTGKPPQDGGYGAIEALVTVVVVIVLVIVIFKLLAAV